MVNRMSKDRNIIDSAFFRLIGIREDNFENRVEEIKEEYQLSSTEGKAYEVRLSDEVYKKIFEKEYKDISDSTYRCFRSNPRNQIVRPSEDDFLEKNISGQGEKFGYPQKVLFFENFTGNKFWEDIRRAEFMLTGSYLSEWKDYTSNQYDSSPFSRIKKGELYIENKKSKYTRTSAWCRIFQEILGVTNHKKLFGLTEKEYRDCVDKKKGGSYKKIRITQYSYAGMRTRQNLIKERIRKHIEEEKNMLEIEKERNGLSSHSACRVENYFAYDMSFGISLASTIFLFLESRYTSEPVFIIEDIYCEGENKEISFETLFKRCIPILALLAGLKCYEVSVSMAEKIFSYLDDVNYLTAEVEAITKDLQEIVNDVNKAYKDYLYLRWDERKSLIESTYKGFIWSSFVDDVGKELYYDYIQSAEKVNQHVDDFFINVYKLKRGIKETSVILNPIFTEENIKKHIEFQEWNKKKRISGNLDREIEKKRNQCIKNIKENLLWQERKKIIEEEIATLTTQICETIKEKRIVEWLDKKHLSTQYEKEDREKIVETIAREELTEKRLKRLKDKTFNKIKGEDLDEKANYIYEENVRDDFVGRMMAQVNVSGSWWNMIEAKIAGIDMEEQIRLLAVDNSLKKINDKLLNKTTELRMGDRIRNYTDLYAQIQTIITTGRTLSR